VIVSDAHLGPRTPEVTATFLRFLAAVPSLGTTLVVNGDLFEFWFEYGSVIPRRAFPVLSGLRRLRDAGVELAVTGGNHDRWGGAFWEDELGASFHREGARMVLAGLRAEVRHGDGVGETHVAARVLHAVTRWPLTVAAFRWVHPDLGMALVNALSPRLGLQTRDAAVLARAAAAQARWARDYLAREHDVDLLVLGHTHRPVIETVGARRWYLNPGAWCDGSRYAVVTADGPGLCVFGE
jgi:UDP-2,3-diacylglucosamine hydrolase